MQPLTLPEQRQIEKLLAELKKGELVLVADHSRLETQEVVGTELLIRVLDIALQTNDALKEAWRKQVTEVDNWREVSSRLRDFRHAP